MRVRRRARTGRVPVVPPGIRFPRSAVCRTDVFRTEVPDTLSHGMELPGDPDPELRPDRRAGPFVIRPSDPPVVKEIEMPDRHTLRRIIPIILAISISGFGYFTTGLASVNENFPQTTESSNQAVPVRFGKVVPLRRYVRLVYGGHFISPDSVVTLPRADIRHLRVVFARDSLDIQDGPQFLKLTTVSMNLIGQHIDENVQYAITFRRLADPAADLEQLERFVGQVNPMGYYNADLMETVPIQVDSLGSWGWLNVRIEPESELVKYYGRIQNKLDFSVRVRGRRIQTGFALSVPKVLYDTCQKDTVSYGNTSAMFRIFALNGKTGERYPIDVGLGTFGVNSPIDVSRKGGGFAVSLYFDVIQMLRGMKLRLPYKVNAGFDVSPFFPIGHKSRILFSARLGITP
jgi:hypothetical protein